MDRDTLLRRKSAIEERFNELAKTKSDSEAEMNRLEGEHRLVLDLLNDVPVIEKPKRIRKVVDAPAQE